MKEVRDNDMNYYWLDKRQGKYKWLEKWSLIVALSNTDPTWNPGTETRTIPILSNSRHPNVTLSNIQCVTFASYVAFSVKQSVNSVAGSHLNCFAVVLLCHESAIIPRRHTGKLLVTHSTRNRMGEIDSSDGTVVLQSCRSPCERVSAVIQLCADSIILFPFS
jgi:hypothetical protein